MGRGPGASRAQPEGAQRGGHGPMPGPRRPDPQPIGIRGLPRQGVGQVLCGVQVRGHTGRPEVDTPAQLQWPRPIQSPPFPGLRPSLLLPRGRCRRGAGTQSWVYDYPDGTPAFAVERRDPGKHFKQWTPAPDHLWIPVGLPAPRPLYQLQAILESEGPVLVVEGEGCADAAPVCLARHGGYHVERRGRVLAGVPMGCLSGP